MNISTPRETCNKGCCCSNSSCVDGNKHKSSLYKRDNQIAPAGTRKRDSYTIDSNGLQRHYQIHSEDTEIARAAATTEQQQPRASRSVYDHCNDPKLSEYASMKHPPYPYSPTFISRSSTFDDYPYRNQTFSCREDEDQSCRQRQRATYGTTMRDHTRKQVSRVNEEMAFECTIRSYSSSRRDDSFYCHPSPTVGAIKFDKEGNRQQQKNTRRSIIKPSPTSVTATLNEVSRARASSSFTKDFSDVSPPPFSFEEEQEEYATTGMLDVFLAHNQQSMYDFDCQDYDREYSSRYQIPEQEHYSQVHPMCQEDSFLPQSTPTTTEAPSRPAEVEVEVSPGFFLPLHGSEETLAAMEYDELALCHCLVCTQPLYCIENAMYVLCPTCRVVSPLDLMMEHEDLDDDENDVKNTTYGNNDIKCERTLLGIGLGVLTEEYHEWQFQRQRQLQSETEEILRRHSYEYFY